MTVCSLSAVQLCPDCLSSLAGWTLYYTILSSFAGLDAAKSQIKSLDTWMDLEKDYGLAGFKKATDLRKTWPHLKVL